MIAVDTNVVIRLLTGDDPKQATVARTLFARSPIWIAKTVLLETEWVLRDFYRFEEHAIRNAFTKLLGLENVQVEDEPAVAAALALAEHGLEFADAIHLVSRPIDAAFVSFDKGLIQRATRAGAPNVSNPSG